MSKIEKQETRIEELMDQLALEHLDNQHIKESTVSLTAQLLDRENHIDKLQGDIKELKAKLADAQAQAQAQTGLAGQILGDAVNLDPSEREKVSKNAYWRCGKFQSVIYVGDHPEIA
jgi:septal ring factor EnvC (AmiA/AmiB activator)